MIDLRNPQGKYGGSATAMANILGAIQQRQQQNRQQAFNSALMTGLEVEGKTIPSIISDFNRSVEGRRKSTFMGRLGNMFDANALSPVPGAAETNLIGQMTGQMFDPFGLKKAEVKESKARRKYYKGKADAGPTPRYTTQTQQLSDDVNNVFEGVAKAIPGATQQVTSEISGLSEEMPNPDYTPTETDIRVFLNAIEDWVGTTQGMTGMDPKALRNFAISQLRTRYPKVKVPSSTPTKPTAPKPKPETGSTVSTPIKPRAALEKSKDTTRLVEAMETMTPDELQKVKYLVDKLGASADEILRAMGLKNVP